MVEELKPKQRQLFNILDHDDESKGIQLLEMSPYMFGFMLDEEDIAQEEDFPNMFYGDDQNGLSIQARFNEEVFAGHKFPEAVRIDFEERDDLPDEMVEKEALDLDAHLRILTYDELNAKFFELDSDENEGNHGASDEQEGEEQEEEETEKETTSTDDLEEMDRAELKAYIKVEDLGIKVFKSHTDDDIRDNILAAMEQSEAEETDESEEEEAEEPPKKTRRKRPGKEAEQKDDRCPHGFIFGVDVDSKKARKKCDQCEEWDDCQDEKDRLAADDGGTGEDVLF